MVAGRGERRRQPGEHAGALVQRPRWSCRAAARAPARPPRRTRPRSPGGRGRRRAPAPSPATSRTRSTQTPAFSGVPGPGTEQHPVVPAASAGGHLVVAQHGALGAELGEVLHQVEDEAVVVVDDEDPARPGVRTWHASASRSLVHRHLEERQRVLGPREDGREQQHHDRRHEHRGDERAAPATGPGRCRQIQAYIRPCRRSGPAPSGGPSALDRRLLQVAEHDQPLVRRPARVAGRQGEQRLGRLARPACPGTGSSTQVDVGDTIWVRSIDVGEPAGRGSRPPRGRPCAPCPGRRTARRWWPGGRPPRSCRPAPGRAVFGVVADAAGRSGSVDALHDRHRPVLAEPRDVQEREALAEVDRLRAAARCGARRRRGCRSQLVPQVVGHLVAWPGAPRSWSTPAGRRRTAAPPGPAVISSSPSAADRGRGSAAPTSACSRSSEPS